MCLAFEVSLEYLGKPIIGLADSLVSRGPESHTLARARLLIAS